MNREEVVHVSEENITQTKRRIKGEGCWKDDAKKRRSRGQAYTGNKGVIKPAKVPPSAQSVNCKCKKGCSELLEFDHKLKLFNDFDLCEDNVKQNTFLMGLLVVTPVNRRRNPDKPEESRTQASITYTLTNGSGGIVKVCKATFLEVFAITKRRIETLVKAKKQVILLILKKEEIKRNVENILRKKKKGFLII
ncbi:hypothetical protein J6590_000442 [Homalodisca vitripennis]|nr:hypothetical protein J6590_000442 [Homalodisca vitripennis]